MPTLDRAAPVLRICPECGLPLRPVNFVCASCGAVWFIAAPSAWFATKRRILQARLRADHRLRRQYLLWTLACLPVLLVPPALALLALWMGRRERAAASGQDDTWVAVVAIVNLLLSCLLLVRLHELAGQLCTWVTAIPNMGHPHPLGDVHDI